MASNSTKENYCYTPLAKLTYNTKVDIYGVVKFIKQPFKSRGSDYCMMLSLVDPSYTDPEEKLKCLLFAKEIKQLPIAEVGDIVRFHRLKVSGFKGSLQGQSGPGWSWVIFSGQGTTDKSGDTTAAQPMAGDATFDIIPLQSSSASYKLNDFDKDMVCKLRQWASDKSGLKERLVTFHDVVVGCYFDIVCQVVSTWLVEDTCRVVRVWDGTQCSCLVRSVDETSDANEELQFDPYLVQKAHGFTHDVFVFDDHVPTADKIEPGDYVKFINLHAASWKSEDKTDDGRDHVELVLHRGSAFGRCVKVMPRKCTDVQTLQMRLESVSASVSLLGHTDGFQSDVTNSQSGTSGLKSSSHTQQQGSSNTESNNHSEKPGTSHDQHLVTRKDGGNSSIHCSTKQCFSGDQKFSGVNCSVHASDREFAVNDNSDSETLDFRVEGVGAVNSGRGHSSAPSAESESRRMQQTITVIVNHTNMEVQSIRHVLEQAVPCKVRVQAQVYDYHPKPTSTANFIHMYCPVCYYLCPYRDVETQKQNGSTSSELLQPGSTYMGVVHYVCPQCSRNRDSGSTDTNSPPNLQYVFMLRFLLQDNTGMLMANVWQKDAVRLLNYIEPEDVLCFKTPLATVQSLLDQLCPPNTPLADRPWMDCCLKAYSTQQGTGYQIFDTVC